MSLSSSIPSLLFSSFPAAFEQLLSRSDCARVFAQHGPRGAGRPKLGGWEWLMARVYHELARSGSFSRNVRAVTGVNISDSALSQRASSIGEKILEEVLPQALRPLAQPDRHPQAFYGDYRLLAVDGTRFNLRNTEAVQQRGCKVRCDRGAGAPAFAHLLCVVLVELGSHQPLAAQCGWQGQGELTLARRLFAGHPLPQRSLVLADRLFGCPSLLWRLAERLQSSDSAVLMRVKSNLNVASRRPLSDGSSLVQVKVVDPSSRRKLGVLELREIHAQIHVEGSSQGEPKTIRLWTSLLDHEAHPAKELVELYARRWEQELFFRELKSHLHARSQLLDALTPETAAQEVLAMLLAAALIARQRQAVAGYANVELLRISFAKVLHKTAAWCELLEAGADLIPKEAIATWIQRMLDDLSQDAVIQKRKPRSCPRTLRQPVKDWPKTKKAQTNALIKRIEITNP